MTAMFPDSGVPASDAKNSIADPNTVNCNELWYSTSRCQPRFDPAAANAMLAEMINHINAGEVAYDCNFLDQLQKSTKYLIQRGIPRGGIAAGGPAVYTVALDPPLTRYNNYLTLTIIPASANNGPVEIDVDGNGLRWVYRNDGQHLVAGDWAGGVPVIIAFWNGNWFNVGFLKSQIPNNRLTAILDLWVNNAIGSDNNDGLENSVGHALYTFQCAIDIAYSYPAGAYPVNIHIMTGTYGRGVTPKYAGPSLNVIGTGPNTLLSGGLGHCFICQGPNHAEIHDIAITSGATDVIGGVVAASSGASVNAYNMYCYSVGWGSHFQASGGTMDIGACTFYGGGWSLYYSNFSGNLSFYGQHQAAAAFSVSQCVMFCASGTAGIASTTPAWGGAAMVTGQKYQVHGNGAVDDQTAGANWFPGTTPGSVNSGGVYY